MSLMKGKFEQLLAARTTGDRDASEDGFVLVMVALLFTVLLAFVGYSVDLGRVNTSRSHAQAAAEAAALGGVTFLPDEPAKAEAIARQIAGLHGYTTEVSILPGSATNRMVVEIDDEVDHYFMGFVGADSTFVQGRAEAEFQPVLELGSPDFVIGNDPETGLLPNYWLSIAGPNAPKDLGDRYGTASCVDPSTAICALNGGVWQNSEYDSTGYKFAIPVTAFTSTRVQIFDPSWVWTGSDCSFPFWPTAAEITDLQNSALAEADIPDSYYNDAALRYATGETEWCTGDDRPFTTGSTLEVTVRQPDDTPWDDTDNAPICTQTFGGYEPMSPYLAPSPSIYELLSPNDGWGDTEWQVKDDGVYTFAEVFRRWATVCDAWSTETGNLIVQIRTLGGDGQNRLSLRAGPPVGTNAVSDVGQSTFARGRLPIYVNSDNTVTKFEPIRIEPAASDRILKVTFFDIGDSTSPGTLQIKPPADANVGYFSDCVFTRTSPAGPVTIASNPDCSLNGVWDSNGFDGQVVSVSVPIDESYSCPTRTAYDCWVSIQATFSGGITDATTWTARIDGDAVRIVG